MAIHPEVPFRPLLPSELGDIGVFIQVREEFRQTTALMPEYLKISDARLAHIAFVDQSTFEQYHYNELRLNGYTEEDSKKNATKNASAQHGTYFETSQLVAIAAKYDRFQIPGYDVTDRATHYFYLIAHEIGHELSPTARSISVGEAARALGFTQTQFEALVRRQVSINPHTLIEYLKLQNVQKPEEILDMYRADANTRGMTSFEYIKFLLINAKDGILTHHSINSQEYDAFAQTMAHTLRYEANGRMIALIRPENEFVIERIGPQSEKVLSEVIADTYMHYALFLRYIEQTQGANASEALSNKRAEFLNQYKFSEQFRSLITPDEITAVSIIDTAIAFGGFERLLKLLYDAQYLQPTLSPKESSLTEQERSAFQNLLTARQSQELVGAITTAITQDGSFHQEVFEGILKHIEKAYRNEKKLIVYIRLMIATGQYDEVMITLFNKFNPFYFNEWVLMAAKPILGKAIAKRATKQRESGVKGINVIDEDVFTKAIGGGTGMLEHMTTIIHESEFAFTPIRIAVDTQLSNAGSRSFENHIQRAIKILAQVRKAKYNPNK